MKLSNPGGALHEVVQFAPWAVSTFTSNFSPTTTDALARLAMTPRVGLTGEHPIGSPRSQ
jgi:hypothetical protein